MNTGTVILTCALFLLLSMDRAPGQLTSATAPGCATERLEFMSQGFRIVAWIMRPNGHGPFPVLIVNHDERLTHQGPKIIEQSATPTLTRTTPCHPLVVSKRWMLFYPEGRGYAGSDGPKLRSAMGSPDRIVRFLEGRPMMRTRGWRG